MLSLILALYEVVWVFRIPEFPWFVGWVVPTWNSIAKGHQVSCPHSHGSQSMEAFEVYAEKLSTAEDAEVRRGLINRITLVFPLCSLRPLR